MAVQGNKDNNRLSSSTTSLGSDDVYCQPCNRDGVRLSADGYCTNCSEHLCDTCFTVHRRHKMSRHHTLLDKENMPKTMSSATPSQSDNFTKPCPKHNIEMIKFYCHFHKTLLCDVCVTLEHTRRSCKVNFINDVSCQVINSKEYRDILKAVYDMTHEANKTLQDMKKLNDKSTKSLTDALADIKRFRTKINQKLDELEKQVEETAKGIQKESSNMTRMEKECEDLSKSLKVKSDAITYFNTSKQADDLFMELKQAEQIIKDCEQSIAKLTAFDVKEYKFEPNKAITNLLSNEKVIGTLKGVNLKLKSRQLSHMDKIGTKTTKDSEICWITGMALLTPNLLIVTDNYNMTVKMVDISSKSILDQQNCSSLWDVSSVSESKIAVTIPDNHSIQFISVSRNKLKKRHTLLVDGECRGISCHKGKMVVSFLQRAKVQILLINGTVLKTFQDDFVLKSPRYLTTSDNYIYVSDSSTRTITKLNWQGEMKGKCDCRSKPEGVTMSDDGTVFVCCYEDNTIREIGEDLTKGQVVVKDITAPQAICCSALTGTLYTNSLILSGEDSDLIKIFKFS